jgi:hypothetical protein
MERECDRESTCEIDWYDAHEEIEVTAEMVSAGVREFALYQDGDDWESTVVGIYRAMEAARAEKIRHS